MELATTSADQIPSAQLPLGAEADPADLTSIRTMIAIFNRQGHTASGFPRVRPQDCERLLMALQGSTEAKTPLFRTHDPILMESFSRVVEQLRTTEVRAYPSEMLKLLLMVAQIRLQQNDHLAVREAIGHYADRPYAMEGDFHTILGVLWCDCQALALAGEVTRLPALALSRMIFLTALRPDQVFRIVDAFAAFLALGDARPLVEGYLEAFLNRYCRFLTLVRRKRGKASVARAMGVLAFGARVLAAGTLYLRRFGELRLRQPAGMVKVPLVTRAMGGIGDLIMMSPGLRALSRQIGTPVRFAIPRRFFPLFEHNPAVQLIDIDGPPIDIGLETRWHNLSNCPAAAYESRHLPHVKKGRVELFAGGMRVKLRELNASGQRPEIPFGDSQLTFRQEFMQAKGLGTRPIIGVQPYSRELYRDYPRMPDLIRELATRYDVLVFHHLEPEILPGTKVVTTAGLSLAQSLSLVAVVNVMVSIDSSFMHAAAAVDVPVVALFGPIDGDIRTVHLPRVELLQETGQFPCAPCWRNEDEPCKITRQTGISPCMAAIQLNRITSAVERLMAEKRGKVG